MSRATLTLLGLALLLIALELVTASIGPYGLFHDELYYWACARRPGLGYVDHPPLAPWVLAATMPVLGDGVLGFSLIPALCGAATLTLTGLMARRLGAAEFGQLIAGLCVIVGPFYLGFFSFYSVNAFEVLFWTCGCFLTLELIRTENERLWLAVGVLTGIALLNKHTFALLPAALAVGLLATPHRSLLRSYWLLPAVAVAALLAFPNLYWNLVNEWPSLAFYRSVGEEKNIPTSPADALLLQFAAMNPATVFVSVPGLLYLLFSRRARRYRALGITFLMLLLVIVFSGQRRGDRIVGSYAIVFAAGGAFWDHWATRTWRRRVRWAVPAMLLLVGALVVPVSLPVLSPQSAESYFEAIGETPELEAADVGHKIPLHLLGRLEWDEVARTVVSAVEELSPDERGRAVVLAPHWVYASVVEYYGRNSALPPVVSPQNAYYFWRREAVGHDIAVSIAIDPAVLARYFAETRTVGMFRCRYCANWRRDMPVTVSYGPTQPIEELLHDWRYFGSGPSPALRPMPDSSTGSFEDRHSRRKVRS